MKLLVCKNCGFNYKRQEFEACPECGSKFILKNPQRERMNLAILGK